jgi:hypothetical protein
LFCKAFQYRSPNFTGLRCSPNVESPASAPTPQGQSEKLNVQDLHSTRAHARASAIDVGGSAKRDDYTRDRFSWLDQVAADPDLPASAFKLAYAIATKLKRNSGSKTLVSADTDRSEVREAWIGCQDLADKIAMSRPTVVEMGRRLERRGHLEIQPGRRGSGHSHHYRLVEKCQCPDILKCQSADICETEKCQPTDISDRENVSRPTYKCQPADMNPFVPSEDITIEEKDSPPLDLGEEVGRRSQSPPPDIDVEFENWFRQYPRRVAKATAKKAYRGIITKKLATAEVLLAGAMRYAAERSGQDAKYTKHPGTWLHGWCWTDEPAPSFARSPEGSVSGFGHHFDQALADARLIAEGGGHE